MAHKVSILVTFFLPFCWSQMVLRKTLFQGNIWPSYVHKDVGSQVKSAIECAAFCNTSVELCNAIFYNSLARFCGLANLRGSYTFMIGQVYQESYGFINQEFLRKQMAEEVVEVQMNKIWTKTFYLNSTIYAPAKAIHCLAECFFVNKYYCEFFIFEEPLCYFGRFDYKNGNILDKVNVTKFSIIKSLVSGRYLQSPAPVQAVDWTPKIYNIVPLLSPSDFLSECKIICMLERNNSCKMAFVQNASCYLGDPFLPNSGLITNITSEAATLTFGNYVKEWSLWNEWSNCSWCLNSRSRNRQCNVPQVNFGGRFCPGNDNERSRCSNLSCFYPSINYTGDLLEGDNGTITNINSPFECQELCLVCDQCQFFSYQCSNKTCFLKAENGTYTYNSDFISGPNSCNSGTG